MARPFFIFLPSSEACFCKEAVQIKKFAAQQFFALKVKQKT